MDDIISIELELELKALKKQVQEQKRQIQKLKQVIADNDLEEELGEDKPISPEEEICIKGIEQILDLVKNKCQTSNDIKDFDILHKNLRMIRGQVTETKGKFKKAQVGDLLKIVEGKSDG
jgi:hypothetical protein